ncbi:MAG: DUF4215 domain-containing protein [Deltaproteobacteria bacterium]
MSCRLKGLAPALLAGLVAALLAGPAPAEADEIADADIICPVTVAFADPSASFALVFFDIDYAGSGGEFAGQGRDVACSTTHAAGSFTDRDSIGTDEIRVAVSGLGSKLDSRSTLVTCVFVPDEGTVLTAGQFSVSTLAALDSDGRVSGDLPTVEITGVSCTSASVTTDDEETATATTSTTTTPSLMVSTTTSTSTTTLRAAPQQTGPTTSSTMVWATLMVSTTTSTSTVPDAGARCGNSQAEAGEQCDDGNILDGDGCDSNCTFTACGNGVLTLGEECDDGNVEDRDGCSSVCTIVECGNGIQEPGEQCDDGNAVAGDGCELDCTRTPTTTTGAPTTTTSTTLPPTTTTTTTTTTSTTSSTSTTTTLPFGRRECEISFDITTTATMSAVQAEVDYSAAPGNFIGAESAVECSEIPGMIGMANDLDGARLLSVAALDPFFGFATPTRLALCNFESGATAPLSEHFVVNVIDATNTSDETITLATEVSVSCSDVLDEPTPSFLRTVACGDADASGKLTANDALTILKSAVKLGPCPTARCDVDGSGLVGATDAVLVLKAALRIPVALVCS